MRANVIFINTEESKIEIYKGKFSSREDVAARVLAIQGMVADDSEGLMYLDRCGYLMSDVNSFNFLDDIESSEGLIPEQISINGRVIWNSKQTTINEF